MNDVKGEIMRQARIAGICEDGYSRLRLCGGSTDMVDYYIENPDWCIMRNLPDLQTIIEKFSDCEGRGVFVNREFQGETLDNLQVYVFHNCTGTIRTGLNAERSIIPMLYFANGCRMTVEGCNHDALTGACPVKIPLHVIGDNEVIAHNSNSVVFNNRKSELIWGKE